MDCSMVCNMLSLVPSSLLHLTLYLLSTRSDCVAQASLDHFVSDPWVLGLWVSASGHTQLLYCFCLLLIGRWCWSPGLRHPPSCVLWKIVCGFLCFPQSSPCIPCDRNGIPGSWMLVKRWFMTLNCQRFLLQSICASLTLPVVNSGLPPVSAWWAFEVGAIVLFCLLVEWVSEISSALLFLIKRIFCLLLVFVWLEVLWIFLVFTKE